MNEESESVNDKKNNIQVHITPEMDYLYRDISNVFVGGGEVVLEFGNFHPSMPGHASISNRIVLSVANAYELQNSLGQALADAQNSLQNKLNK